MVYTAKQDPPEYQDIYSRQNVLSLLEQDVHENTKQPILRKFIPLKDLGSEFYDRLIEQVSLLETTHTNNLLSVYEHHIVTRKGKTYLLVTYEDFPLVLLAGHIKHLARKNKNVLFCHYAIQMATALMDIHKLGFVHMGLNPYAFLYDRKHNWLKLDAVAWEQAWLPEYSYTDKPGNIDELIYYIAPEQTGRMNHSPDFRANLYSLGIIFYEILTGQVPYSATDSLEIIHSHMAREITPPSAVDENIHPDISRTVLKLLQKHPCDRYQSISGLLFDLKEIESKLKHHLFEAPFIPGKKDVSSIFDLPDKLYGREKEISLLQNCYDSVRAGNSYAVFVSGDPGVGKTALMREVGKYVRSTGGIFLSGKYEQRGENTPVSAPKTAISKLVNWLLIQDRDVLKHWRKKIQDAITPNGQILVELIPEMELIIGKQPQACELPPQEAKVRASLIMEKFVSLFLKKEHPLVLFLDDLQWADNDTLDLGLSFLLAKQRPYCLILGCYRDNQIYENHPVHNFLQKLEQNNVPFDKIHLQPLSELQTSAMVSETISKKENDAKPLAKIIYNKTEGNPFFINQFMTSLYARGIINYSFERGAWTYDTRQVEATNTTDDLDILVLDKINNLPASTLEVLQSAACIGNRPDWELLSLLHGLGKTKIEKHLERALNAGLLSEVNEKEPSGIQFASDEEENRNDTCGGTLFLHDHILQSIYRTIPKQKADYLHWKIGRTMLQRNKSEIGTDEIFDIVHQFRKGLQYVDSEKEKTELARLNLMAGQLAMESISFQSALSYLRFAADLTGQNNQEQDQELISSIYSKLATSEFMVGNLEQSEIYFNLLLENATSLLEKINAYNSMITLNTAAGEIERALHLGRNALNLLNIELPRDPGKPKLLYLLLKLRIAWGLRRGSHILEAPEDKDEFLSSTLTLLTNIGLVAFYFNPRLCTWIILKGCFLGLKNPEKGLPHKQSSFGLIALGAFLGSLFGFVRMGNNYAKIGNLLLNRQPYGAYQDIACFVTAFFGRHWHEPASKSIEYYKMSYEHAFKTGNINYIGHSINGMFMTRLFLGDKLDDIYDYHKRHEMFIKNTHSPIAISIFDLFTQYYQCLKGQTQSILSLDTNSYNLETEYKTVQNKGNEFLVFNFLLIRLKLYVLYQQWERAFEITEKIAPLVHIPVGTLLQAEYYFYSFLTATGLIYSGTSFRRKKKCKKIITQGIKKMKRCVKLRSDNFQHMLQLMLAEKEKIAGNGEKAMHFYRKAIHTSKSGEFTHVTAIAFELAGQFLLNLDDFVAARSYLEEARRYYKQWGATAKVSHLENNYPQLLNFTHEKTPESFLHYFDLKSIVETLQAISQEIEVRKLFSRLMPIILESSGANRAVFISDKEDELLLEVESRNQEEDVIDNLKKEPLERQNDPLLTSTVYYVKRTRETVVMDDVIRESDFLRIDREESILPKSLLCMPIISNNNLVGILYLENTLINNVFTRDRMELLEMIGTQAGISFENATLYEQVSKNEQDLDSLSQKMRSLYSELMLTEERERRRIATELHDRIGHALATAKMQLIMLRDKDKTDDHKNSINQVLEIIEQSISDTRTLTFELSPPILYHLGLAAALDWLCEETREKHGLDVYFTDNTQEANMGQKTSILCFQILRELMFNAVKHAKASTIHVSLECIRDWVRMRIEDDGIGFDTNRQQRQQQDKKGGFGLFSIKERLHLFGGHMEIESTPRQGTRISITTPMDNSETSPQEHINGQSQREVQHG